MKSKFRSFALYFFVVMIVIAVLIPPAMFDSNQNGKEYIFFDFVWKTIKMKSGSLVGSPEEPISILQRLLYSLLIFVPPAAMLLISSLMTGARWFVRFPVYAICLGVGLLWGAGTLVTVVLTDNGYFLGIGYTGEDIGKPLSYIP